MHWAYFWATVLWNLCQTSMQPDSKQRTRYLRPGTFNSTEGLPQRLQTGSVACIKSQRSVGQWRAVLCPWVRYAYGIWRHWEFCHWFKKGWDFKNCIYCHLIPLALVKLLQIWLRLDAKSESDLLLKGIEKFTFIASFKKHFSVPVKYFMNILP